MTLENTKIDTKISVFFSLFKLICYKINVNLNLYIKIRLEESNNFVSFYMFCIGYKNKTRPIEGIQKSLKPLYLRKKALKQI